MATSLPYPDPNPRVWVPPGLEGYEANVLGPAGRESFSGWQTGAPGGLPPTSDRLTGSSAPSEAISGGQGHQVAIRS